MGLKADGPLSGRVLLASYPAGFLIFPVRGVMEGGDETQ